MTGNYLLHTNFEYEENPLIIQAANLDIYSNEFEQGQFKCVVCEGGRCVEEGSMELFRLDTVLAGGGSEVHCQQREVRGCGQWEREGGKGGRREVYE